MIRDLDTNDILRDNVFHAWPEYDNGAVNSPSQIGENATRAVIKREKTSHKGIGQRVRLRELVATAVNQDFFEEICALSELEYLNMGWPVTIKSLAGIARLTKLRTVHIDSPRNVTDFSPLLSLPHLKKLFITNAKHLDSVDFLASAHHLHSIGIEGSIWTAQKIESLKPLGGLRNLEGLFLTNAILRDKELSYLARCPQLRILSCARFAPKEQFQRLRVMMPNLQCQWCDQYEIG